MGPEQVVQLIYFILPYLALFALMVFTVLLVLGFVLVVKIVWDAF